MRTLVTGGAGFVGSHVVDALLAQDYEVYVVDDLSNGKITNLANARASGGMKFHRFDVRSDGMEGLFRQVKPDVVLHLAAQPSVPASVTDPIHDADVNVIGLVRVLESCVATGVRKIVFTSSGGAKYGTQETFPIPETATGHPASPYGITKKVADDYLHFYREEHGLDYVTLAPANIYGPRQDTVGESGVVAIFSSKLIAGEAPTIFGTGDATRDYVYVEDVADAFAKACEFGSGEVVNISTGIETTVNELFAVVAKEAGYKGDADRAPPRPGDVERSSLDPAKAARVLNWRPWTSLADGVRQTVAWFRQG